VIQSEEELPPAYKTVQVALNGAKWEMLLDALPEELRQTLDNAVREVTPNTEEIKLAAARQEKVVGAEVKRGEHLRVE
jgi:fructose-1-phosphate kinase PfkB-like protein